MGALTPGPEDAKKQKNGADELANSTHDLKNIPATAAITGPQDVLNDERSAVSQQTDRQGRMPSGRLALGSPNLISQVRSVHAAHHDQWAGAWPPPVHKAVSHITAERALTTLKDEGLIAPVIDKGYYVAGT
jgi:hypothetical protein